MISIMQCWELFSTKLENVRRRDSSAFTVIISIFTYNFYLKSVWYTVDIRVTCNP